MREVVRVLPTGGSWGQVGADIAPGRPPEGLVCSANEWGSDTASFMLHRDGSVIWNDLLPGAPIEIERDGVVGWAGRVEEISADNGDGTQIVSCKGWQYHLDDDLLRFFGVRRKLTAWQDWRSNLAATLSTWGTALQAEVGEGGIILTHPANSPGGNTLAYFDAGPGNVVKRVVIGWAKSANGGASSPLMFRAGRTLAELDTGFINTYIYNSPAASSGTYSYTLSTPCRYVGVQFSETANTSEAWAKVNSAILFGETAYESGGDSALTLDVLAKYILASGAVPLLSQATDGISVFNFGIPELDPQQRQTPREMLSAMQALHDCRIQIDVDRKLIVSLRPSTPLFTVGAASQHSFKDGSISREPIASGVYIEGNGADGGLLESQVDSSAITLPSKQGYNKRVSLPIGHTVTTALINQLAPVYLANHQSSPFKGEMVVQGWGDSRAVVSDHPVHAFHHLTKTEELMRFGDRLDPDTGAVCRDGRMKTVTYTADTEESVIAIDNESRKFEALAGRIASVVGQ